MLNQIIAVELSGEELRKHTEIELNGFLSSFNSLSITNCSVLVCTLVGTYDDGPVVMYW